MGTGSIPPAGRPRTRAAEFRVQGAGDGGATEAVLLPSKGRCGHGDALPA